MEARDKQQTTATAPANKWMRLPLCHSWGLVAAVVFRKWVGRQILYCYVMNIFPPRPDSAEKAVSSVQRLIIGHSTYPSGLYAVMSDHSNTSYHSGRRLFDIGGSFVVDSK